jgi:hypothetical protein
MSSQRDPIPLEELADLSLISKRDISKAIAKGSQKFKDWLSGQRTNPGP